MDVMNESKVAPVTNLAAVRIERRRVNAQRRKRRVTAKQKRTVGQAIASLGGSFMPIVSFTLAHTAGTNPIMWVLVVAALSYSLPSVAAWAMTWTRSTVKSYGFAVLLEGVLVFAPGGEHLATAIVPYLGGAGLTALVLINAVAAWSKAKGK
jgi:hypothetical protein